MNENANKQFCIIGAGLAGTLLSIFLTEKGMENRKERGMGG